MLGGELDLKWICRSRRLHSDFVVCSSSFRLRFSGIGPYEIVSAECWSAGKLDLEPALSRTFVLGNPLGPFPERSGRPLKARSKRKSRNRPPNVNGV